MMSSISKKTYEIDDIKHVKKYTLVILKCNKQALWKMSIISLISTYIPKVFIEVIQPSQASYIYSEMLIEIEH